MSIPVTVADLAKAAGLTRADPSTLPLDIVRLAFASPDGASDAAAGRRGRRFGGRSSPAGTAGIACHSRSSPTTWRAARARARKCPTIVSRLRSSASRATALLYHGLMALDPATLAWIDGHPDVLDDLLEHPGTTAAFARSIHIRGGSIVTPGDAADDAVAGDCRGGSARAAGLRRQADRRAQRPGGDSTTPWRISTPRTSGSRWARPAIRRGSARAQRWLDAVMHESRPAGCLDEYPFLRADTDLLLFFRRSSSTRTGCRPALETGLGGIFGEQGNGRPAVDAAWLATGVLTSGGTMARRRARDVSFRAARPGVRSSADPAVLTAALTGLLALPGADADARDQRRRDAAAFAAAGRAAEALGRDDDAVMACSRAAWRSSTSRAAPRTTPARTRQARSLSRRPRRRRAARRASLAGLRGTADSLPAIGDLWRRSADADALVLQAHRRPAAATRPSCRVGRAAVLSRSRRSPSCAASRDPEATAGKPLDDGDRAVERDAPGAAGAQPRRDSSTRRPSASRIRRRHGGAVWRRHRLHAGCGRAPAKSPRLAAGDRECSAPRLAPHRIAAAARPGARPPRAAAARSDRDAGPVLAQHDGPAVAGAHVALIDGRAAHRRRRATAWRARSRVDACASRRWPRRPGALDAVAAEAPLSEWRAVGDPLAARA